MAYKFAAEEFYPHASEWDKTKHFPKDQYRKAAELGFGGIYVDDEWNGSGLGRLEASLIFEALSTGKLYSFFFTRFFQAALDHLRILASTTCVLA
jgi:alkylation response protein AidB-like acyl-CoA dehydrogenase